MYIAREEETVFDENILISLKRHVGKRGEKKVTNFNHKNDNIYDQYLNINYFLY
jgi:hypothetical protein